VEDRGIVGHGDQGKQGVDAGGIVEARRGPEDSEGTVVEAGESPFNLAPNPAGAVGPERLGAVGGRDGKFPIRQATGYPGGKAAYLINFRS